MRKVRLNGVVIGYWDGIGAYRPLAGAKPYGPLSGGQAAAAVDWSIRIGDPPRRLRNADIFHLPMPSQARP